MVYQYHIVPIMVCSLNTQGCLLYFWQIMKGKQLITNGEQTANNCNGKVFGNIEWDHQLNTAGAKEFQYCLVAFALPLKYSFSSRALQSVWENVNFVISSLPFLSGAWKCYASAFYLQALLYLNDIWSFLFWEFIVFFRNLETFEDGSGACLRSNQLLKSLSSDFTICLRWLCFTNLNFL